MKAVILADKYSKETIKKIVEIYKGQGINSFIICFSGKKEKIEEIELADCNIIVIHFNGQLESGGQLLKIANLLSLQEPFFLTYGDFLCNVELSNFLDFHNKQGKILTMALIKLERKNIFGGYMLVDYDAFDYIVNVGMKFENEPVSRLAEDDEIGWYFYKGKYEAIYQHMQIYNL